MTEVSAKDAHKMMISTVFGIFIVVLAIMLAGTSNAWGNAMIAVMILILLVDGVTNVSTFAKFIEGSSFLPTKSTTPTPGYGANGIPYAQTVPAA